MGTWKRLTGAVDSSAQSFLKNKRFSREKKKFTWDWHAWNLALVSTPSLLLAYYLSGVEKQMLEEAAMREEIQERTGVSSRGFLIPKKEVREEVMGMLSAGNQRGGLTGGEDDQGERQDDEDGSERKSQADFESIQRRLAAIESMLRVQGNSKQDHAGEGQTTGPTLPRQPVSSQGSKVANASNTAREEDESRAEAARGRSAIDKAIETASAAGSWVIKTGEIQGQRLLRLGRDWLAEQNRGEDGSAAVPGRFGSGKGEWAKRPAAEIAVAEVQRQEDPSSGKALDSVGTSTAKQTAGDTAAVSDSSGSEGAWRRGRLDEKYKER
eukprot:g15288.t1